MTEPWAWDATRTAAAIRAGEITAREVAEATLARIDAVNPALNALVAVTGDEALAAADAADAAVRAGGPVGPLHGVPVTIKVNVDQKGQATTNGIRPQAGTIASADAPLVANLRRAGAVIVGRTNTPAFSLRWFTDNALHGRTMNPWGAGLAPGGSSGGAGVAAATGMCAVASGNDYGGSVRHPAMVNGVVGLRPTTGRVAAFTESGPARPLSSQVMSVQGPLARSVADAALALDVMAGADARDPFQVPVPPVAAGPGRPARVALFRGAAAAPVAEALDRAAGALSDAGWEVVEAAPPAFDAATDLWRDLVYHDMAVYLDGPLEAAGDPAVTRNLALMAEARAVLPASEVLALYTERQRIAQAWSTFFEAHPILLTATSWRHALAIDADQESAAALEALVTDQAPMLATAVLGLPGLSVPTHLAEGAPTGVQLVSRWFREDLMVAAGQVIEAAMGRLTPIDPRH